MNEGVDRIKQDIALWEVAGFIISSA